LLLLSGLLMGAIGIVDFLPTLGLAIFPFGGLAVTLGNLINAYTTWKYRLFEITPAYAADQLMDSMSDGVVLIDRDGVVRLVNPSACEILGIDRASLLSRLPPAEFAEVVLGWQHVPFFPANDASLGEREYVTPDGTHRMLDVNVALLREPGLEPGVAVITLRDITAAVRAQEQIERLAYYDSLTHLPNRLLLRERFDEVMRHALHGPGPLQAGQRHTWPRRRGCTAQGRGRTHHGMREGNRLGAA
jgi:PAS domain S-box-containing protein